MANAASETMTKRQVALILAPKGAAGLSRSSEAARQGGDIDRAV
jgi:hypothetical protein